MIKTIGNQYRCGYLRTHDVAELLGVSVSDAVFELERHGFARPLSVVTIDEPARVAIYQRLRKQRYDRVRVSAVDQDLVERDVIASERIEGVDARAWIHKSIPIKLKGGIYG